MVKLLMDCCYQYIAMNIQTFTDLDDALTSQQKEVLLSRMSIHQQLTPERICFVKKFLFTAHLTKLELCHTLDVNDSLLRSLSQYACQFQHIRLENCKNVSDDGIFPLLQNQPRLKQLQLKSLSHVVGSGLSPLQSNSLVKLELTNLMSLKDQYVVQLVSNCPNIKYLDLQYCRELSDSCIMGIAAILKGNLNVLKISGNSLITDQSLESLIKNNVNLTEMKLYGLIRLKEHTITKLLSKLSLRSVDLSYTCGYNGGIADLSAEGFSNTLQNFISCGVQVPSMFFNELTDSCPNLTALELCGMDAVNDVTIRHIVKCLGKQLKKLDLSYCNQFTDLGLQSIIHHCSSLECLSLQFYKGKGEPLRDLLRPEHNKQAECLKKLYFPGCRNFEGDLLHDLVLRVPNLTDLNATVVKGVNDELLFALSRHCTKLQNVNFKGCKEITDDGMCSLAYSCNLVNVTLSGIHNLTDKVIFVMASCLSNSLHSLHISGCNRISSHVVRYLKDISVNGLYVQHRTPSLSNGQLMAKNLDTGDFCRVDLLGLM